MSWAGDKLYGDWNARQPEPTWQTYAIIGLLVATQVLAVVGLIWHSVHR